MVRTEYILGSDIGTSGCKTIIFDTNGNYVGSASQPYRTISLKPGWAEQNPEDWYDAFKTTVKNLLSKHEIHGTEIVSLGLDGMMNSPTFLDKSNSIIRSSIIWMDQRSEPQAEYEEKYVP